MIFCIYRQARFRGSLMYFRQICQVKEKNSTVYVIMQSQLFIQISSLEKSGKPCTEIQEDGIMENLQNTYSSLCSTGAWRGDKKTANSAVNQGFKISKKVSSQRVKGHCPTQRPLRFSQNGRKSEGSDLIYLLCRNNLAKKGVNDLENSHKFKN